MAKAKDEDEDFKSSLDLIFEEIETGLRLVEASDPRQAVEDDDPRAFRTPPEDFKYVPSDLVRNTDKKCVGDLGGINPEDDFALSNYKAFKTAAGKTLKSIIVSCNVRTMPLAIREVRRMLEGVPDADGNPTGRCGMALDTLGDPDQKAAIFAVMSDTDKTFAFLHAIMMWQTMNALCEKALTSFHGKLPTPVNFILDEFANIGTLPDIEQTIAVTRSRNIWLSIILQSLSQLEARYEKKAKTIIDCCDTTLFLGGKSTDTNKELAEMIGKETIDTVTFNESRGGQSNSYTKNHQAVGRDLMDAAEIGKLDRDKAIVLIAGAKPLMDYKYPLDKHPRYAKLDPGHSPVKRGAKTIPAEYDKPFDYIEYERAQVKGVGGEGEK